jgi:hypothetical protein
MEVTLSNLKNKVKELEENIETGGGSGFGGKKKAGIEEEI